MWCLQLKWKRGFWRLLCDHSTSFWRNITIRLAASVAVFLLDNLGENWPDNPNPAWGSIVSTVIGSRIICVAAVTAVFNNRILETTWPVGSVLIKRAYWSLASGFRDAVSKMGCWNVPMSEVSLNLEQKSYGYFEARVGWSNGDGWKSGNSDTEIVGLQTLTNKNWVSCVSLSPKIEVWRARPEIWRAAQGNAK